MYWHTRVHIESTRWNLTQLCVRNPNLSLSLSLSISLSLNLVHWLQATLLSSQGTRSRASTLCHLSTSAPNLNANVHIVDKSLVTRRHHPHTPHSSRHVSSNISSLSLRLDHSLSTTHTHIHTHFSDLYSYLTTTWQTRVPRSW